MTMPAKPLAPDVKKQVRTLIADYCERAEKQRLRRHYTQQRRYTGLGLRPEAKQADDCGVYCAKAVYWAAAQAKVKIGDPLGCNYDGWGYTGTMLDYLDAYPAPEDAYLVGDIAIFGSKLRTVHAIICRKRGDRASAVFSSHGHEWFTFDRDAPEPVSLTHAKAAQTLVGVYRLPELR